MTHKFKAGEYKTKGGGVAVVSEIGPDGVLFGRVTSGCKSCHWFGCSWHPNGDTTHKLGGWSLESFALLPPTRQVWVAVWRWPEGDAVFTCSRESLEGAEEFSSCDDRTRIAVLGPIDVPS